MTANRMRPFGDTISLDAARAILDRTGGPIGRTERVPLQLAAGRVLARDVIAPGDVPPFTRAGMDGYAVRASDTLGATSSQPRILRRIATIYTGDAPIVSVSEGTCVEISTGAPMPDGADAVVMVEQTTCDAAGDVSISIQLRPRENVGRRGTDLIAGQTVVSAGDTLNSSRVGALAAVGTTTVDVYQRIQVAILSTGNEIVEPGIPLALGQIYDINRFTLGAVVSENGGIPVPYPPVSDTLDALLAALDQCLIHDIVVFSGGSSVGERDLIRDAIAARGSLLFHGIAVKPGKPTGLGLVDGKPVLAMPGYPTSCLSNAHILLVPLLRRLARLSAALHTTTTALLARTVESAVGKHQFLSVRLVEGLAVPAFKSSGDITSMSRADGYIEIPADVESVAAGTPVAVTLF